MKFPAFNRAAPLLGAVLGVFFSLSFSAPGEETGLRELVDEALENNPRLQAAYREWEAARLRVRPARSLPDPKLSYTYFFENVETKVGPQEAKYGLSQKIPFPGKLSLKGKTVQKHARMIRERYEAAKKDIIKNVKLAYYDTWWSERAIRVTESEKSILEDLEKVARKRYETGQAPQQDVIKADIELSRLTDKLSLLKRQRRSLAARMNSLLNRPPGSPLGRLKEFSLADLQYSLPRLHLISSESRPELKAAALEIERRETQESLAKLDYWPDLTLGANYIQIGDGSTALPDDGRDAWTGTISVNLPIWWGRRAAQLRERKRGVEAGRNQYRDLINRVGYEVEDLFFRLENLRETVSLYKTALIPQTEEAFRAARTAYETGRVDFLNWLQAETVLLQTRLTYYKSIADYQKTLALLERAVGRDLDEKGDLER